jgi:hypothetical protein
MATSRLATVADAHLSIGRQSFTKFYAPLGGKPLTGIAYGWQDIMTLLETHEEQ